MKKYYYFLTLACTLILFSSCKPNDDPTSDAPELKTLTQQDEALTLTFKSANAPYEQVVLTETGKAILTVNPKTEAPATRAGLLPDYIFGHYKLNGDVYTIYTEDNQFVCSLQLIKTDDVITSTKVFFSSSVSEGITYVVEAIGKVSDSNLTQDLCRNWNIRNSITGDVTATKVFEGTAEAASFNAIFDYAKTKAKFDETIPADMIITDIMLTQSGSFIVLFKNGKIFVGNWGWKNEKTGELSYSWDGDQKIYSNESGKATFDLQSYRKVTYYTLTLSATIADGGKTYNLSIAFNLEEK